MDATVSWLPAAFTSYLKQLVTSWTIIIIIIIFAFVERTYVERLPRRRSYHITLIHKNIELILCELRKGLSERCDISNNSPNMRFLTRFPPIARAGKTPRHYDSTQSRRRRHFRPFCSNFDKCRQEVVAYVIFGVAEEQVGMDVYVGLQFGDSTLNSLNYSTRSHPFYALLGNI